MFGHEGGRFLASLSGFAKSPEFIFFGFGWKVAEDSRAGNGKSAVGFQHVLVGIWYESPQARRI